MFGQLSFGWVGLGRLMLMSDLEVTPTSFTTIGFIQLRRADDPHLLALWANLKPDGSRGRKQDLIDFHMVHPSVS
jgi:hypothetical protein